MSELHQGQPPVSKKQRHSTPIAAPTATPQELVAVAEEAIARRAYEKFEARGCKHGHDREDWAAAVEELGIESPARP